jgi:hypothetical protein
LLAAIFITYYFLKTEKTLSYSPQHCRTATHFIQYFLNALRLFWSPPLSLREMGFSLPFQGRDREG